MDDHSKGKLQDEKFRCEVISVDKESQCKLDELLDSGQKSKSNKIKNIFHRMKSSDWYKSLQASCGHKDQKENSLNGVFKGSKINAGGKWIDIGLVEYVVMNQFGSGGIYIVLYDGQSLLVNEEIGSDIFVLSRIFCEMKFYPKFIFSNESNLYPQLGGQ